MWFFACLTLVLITSTKATENDVKIVNTPSDLKVRKDSDHAVEIAWDFEKPEGVLLRDVEFILLLESKRLPPQIFYHRFNSKPFKAGLTDLLPGTEYTVKLMATCLKWMPSTSAVVTFTTLKTDYPTPFITSVKERRRFNFMEFYLTYGVEWLPFLLHHFEVTVCDRSCSKHVRNRTEFHARVPVEYQSGYSISVAAIYNAGDYGFVRRESQPHIGRTERGRPGEVFDFMAEQQGNTIVLEWHPPYHPNGPISYYEVFVADLDESNGHVRRIAEEMTSDTPALNQVLDGGAFFMGFETLDTDRHDAPAADKLKAFKLEQCKPVAPLFLVILKKTSKAVRFRIIFEKPSNSSLYKIDHAHSMRRLYLGSGVADAFNLSPFTRLHYKIRSCITFEGKSVDICGNFTDFNAISNVAEPSRVLYPEASVSNGQLIVSWQVPEEPRGPIDGYKLTIQPIGNTTAATREIDLNATEHSYIFREYVEGELYEIGIAAFNLDLEDNRIQHVGAWRFVLSPNTCVLNYIALPLFIVFVIFIIGYSCFFNCSDEKEQQQSSRSELRMLGN